MILCAIFNQSLAQLLLVLLEIKEQIIILNQIKLQLLLEIIKQKYQIMFISIMDLDGLGMIHGVAK